MSSKSFTEKSLSNEYGRACRCRKIRVDNPPLITSTTRIHSEDLSDQIYVYSSNTIYSGPYRCTMCNIIYTSLSYRYKTISF